MTLTRINHGRRGARLFGTLCAVVLLAHPSIGSAQQAGGVVSTIKALGQPGSVIAGGASGGLLEQFQLEVAPGRRDVLPKLGLLYNSLSSEGILGQGFDFNPGRIQRSTAHGVPTFTNADTFSFVITGSGSDLTPIGGNSYRSTKEMQFQQFTFLGDRWEMRLAQGVVYRFGETPQSRVNNGAWHLTTIQDTNGNTVTYDYVNDLGTVYLKSISYTGYAPTGDKGANRVTFDYEARPDVRVSYPLAVRQERALRLSRASVFASGRLVRRFAFGYTTSPVNGISLLASITLVGTDDASTLTARSYQYQGRTLGWTGAVVDNSIPFDFIASDGADKGVQVSDVNGDNRVDMIANDGTVALGVGNGQFAVSTSWTNSFRAIGVNFVTTDRGLDLGVRLIDINGDIRPDVVIANASRHEVFLNTGLGWAHDDAYTAAITGISERVLTQRQFLPGMGPDAGDGGCTTNCEEEVDYVVQFKLIESNNDNVGVVFADVNGDGLSDIVWSYRNTTQLVTLPGTAGRVPVEVRAVYLNTGSGFTRSTTYSDSLESTQLAVFDIDSQPNGYDVFDVNGDGLGDIIRTQQTSPETRAVFLNTGAGWALDTVFTASLQATDVFSIDQDHKSLGLLPADMNGDGLLDFIRADKNVRAVFLNFGKGWFLDPTLTAYIQSIGLRLVDDDANSLGVRRADVNADGNSDLIQSRTDQPHRIQFAAAGQANLLIRAVSAYGEVSDVQYGTTSQFDNTGGDGIQDLPLVLPVPLRVTRDDGRGHRFDTTLNFRGGAMDNGAFAGFAQVEALNPRGFTERSRYAQGGVLGGSLLVKEVIDSGVVRSRKTLGYEVTSPLPGVSQVKATQIDEETLDPGGSLHTRIRSRFDEFLNTIEILKDGDLSVTGDEGRTVITHAINLSLGIVDPVARMTVFDASGNKFSERITLYDHLPEGQVGVGNVTALVQTVRIGGPQVSQSFEHDRFGNLTAATDFSGQRSTFTFDSGTSTFRVTARNPLGHVTTSSFDPGFGGVLLDVDPNGQSTTHKYDVFGRVVEERKPGDELSPFGTKTVIYSAFGNATAQFVLVKATETPGRPDTLDSKSFFDGYGQVYRTETESAGSSPVIIATEFDDLGRVISSGRPRFASEPAAFTTTQFDALGRQVGVTGPDGVSRTIQYAGTTRQILDRRGNRTVVVQNAYGKVLEQHQFVGGQDQVTRYEYNVVGDPVRVTDARGEVTKFTYDARQNRTSLDDPSAGLTTYSFDPDSRVRSQTTSDGRVITYHYDALGRLVEKTLPKTDAWPVEEVQRFKYDEGGRHANALGRLTRVEDASGTLKLSYDGRGNVVERRRITADDTFLVGRSFDSLDRIQKLEYPDGFGIRYHYNRGGQVDQVLDDKGRPIVQQIDYTGTGQIRSIKYGNGVVSDRTYDILSQINTLKTIAPRQALQDLRYTFDLEGNITSQVDGLFGRNQSFTYDEKNRLTNAEGAFGVEAYRYDAIGNILRKGSLAMDFDPIRKQQVICGIDLSTGANSGHGPSDPGSERGFRDCLESLTARAVQEHDTSAQQKLAALGRLHQLSPFESERFFTADYDKRGNMIRKNDRRFIYDLDNRLRKVVEGNKVIEENIYDANGGRVFRSGFRGDETTFIDEVFEASDGGALRHVRIGDFLVASVSQPGRINLISETQFLTSEDSDADQPSTGATCTLGPNQGLPPPYLGGLLFLGWILRPHRNTRRRLGRAARIAWEVTKGAMREARRRSGRWFTALMLVPVLVCGALRAEVHADNQPKASTFFYHADHINSVGLVTDDRANVVDRNFYKPFGEQFTPKGTPSINPPVDLEYSFQGQRLDRGTGLYYFGARHYDAVMGRFINADTQVASPTNPQSLHRYAFAFNNPVRYTDPTGHFGWDDLFTIFLVVLLIAAIVITFVPGVGQIVGPVLAQVALYGLIGAAIVGAIGGALALGLYLTGTISGEAAFGLFQASIFIGFLGGAVYGLILIGAFAAAVGSTAFVLSQAFAYALGGALILGGYQLFTGGSTEDVLKGLLLGALIGAAIGVGIGFVGYSGAWAIIKEKLALKEIIGAIIGGVIGSAAIFLLVALYKWLDPFGKTQNSATAQSQGALTGSFPREADAFAIDPVLFNTRPLSL